MNPFRKPAPVDTPKLTPTEMLMRLPTGATVSSDSTAARNSRVFECRLAFNTCTKGLRTVHTVVGSGVSPDAAIEAAWLAWTKIIGALE